MKKLSKSKQLEIIKRQVQHEKNMRKRGKKSTKISTSEQQSKIRQFRYGS